MNDDVIVSIESGCTGNTQDERDHMNDLTDSQIAAYRDDGFLIIRDIIPLRLIKRLYDATTHLFAKYDTSWDPSEEGHAPWHNPAFHQKMIQLRQDAPLEFGALYDSVQTSIALQQLTSHEAITNTAATLLKQEAIGLSATGFMLRMDAPNDTRNRLEWHQESSYYTQNLCSDHGLVAWIPLQTLSHEHGPICICPQSHAGGKLQNDPSGKGEYGESQQYIVPAEHIARYETTPVLAQPGDAVLFHMDLFHKSGHNASHEIRFTAGVRYHSMLTDDFVPGRLRYVENPAVRKRHLQGAST